MGLRFLLLVLAIGLALPATEATAQTALSWNTLSSVTQRGGRPQFGRSLQRLDGRTVRLTGYMLPLEQSATQSTFLLTAQPMADCFYCIPSGPESFVEIRMARPTRFTYDRITLTGRLSLLRRDPIGFYRITGARVR